MISDKKSFYISKKNTPLDRDVIIAMDESVAINLTASIRYVISGGDIKNYEANTVIELLMELANVKY
jgi:hypothetical protein